MFRSGFFFCDDRFVVLFSLRLFFGGAVFCVFALRVFGKFCHLYLQDLFDGRAQDLDGEVFKGKVHLDFIDNQADTKTGTLTIQLEATNPDMEIIPGGYVMVNCFDKFETPQLAVDVSALMTDGKNNYVFVVGKNNIIERRLVTKGEVVNNKQIITSGLSLCETVVIGGLNKVKPGDKVIPYYAEQDVDQK